MARSSAWLCAALLWAGAASAGDPIADFEQAQQHLFEEIAPSVVYLGAGQSFGSGFFVSDDGLILTNAHVVGEAEQVEVVLHDGTRLKGKVVERAADRFDLALVKVERRSKGLPLEGFSELRVGSWVGAVGHGAGGIWTFTSGMVSNIYPDGADKPVFQTQTPLNPGNSGGPFFDRRGRVVGVATAGMKDSQNINFAIRTDAALKRLKGLSGACECLVLKAPSGVPIFVDGKLVGQGPQAIVPAVRKSYEVFAIVGGQMRRLILNFPTQREADLEKTAAR